MSTPVQQGGASLARATNSTFSSNSFLYAELQHSGIGKQASPACRIPRAPITPRPLNQAQQRNVVRQWMGLPPIESNWQRAGRQASQAASYVAQAAGQSFGQLASLAGAAWDGMHEVSRQAFIAGIPGLHIGFPGAAAVPVAPATPSAPAREEMLSSVSEKIPLELDNACALQRKNLLEVQHLGTDMHRAYLELLSIYKEEREEVLSHIDKISLMFSEVKAEIKVECEYERATQIKNLHRLNLDLSRFKEYFKQMLEKCSDVNPNVDAQGNSDSVREIFLTATTAIDEWILFNKEEAELLQEDYDNCLSPLTDQTAVPAPSKTQNPSHDDTCPTSAQPGGN